MIERKLKAVIFDWAGTTVDYGSFAPLQVFVDIFRSRGIDITLDEGRRPMGLPKLDHIRALMQMPRISELWQGKYGRAPENSDIRLLYNEFEPALIEILKDFSTPIPGVVDMVNKLRDSGLKIGSTTGYNDKMMDIVVRAAAEQGYAPDCYVTPDGLPAGRPAPFMCYQNAIRLGVYPMSTVVKVGDTISDIHEGLNAGCWSVGVVEGSSVLGLRVQDKAVLNRERFQQKCDIARAHFINEGAHFAIGTIDELTAVIETINGMLSDGLKP